MLSSLGLSLIIIYMSYSNIGYSLFEKLGLILKTPSTYLFLIGTFISLKALLYDLLKKEK